MGFYWKYFLSLVKHKWLVFKAFWELRECFNHDEWTKGWVMQGLLHDLDKFRPNDFICYARRWRKSEKERTAADIEAYEQSHWRHVTHNKHHWQYWLVETPSGTIAREMEWRYMVELMLDWLAASYYSDGLPNWDYLKKLQSSMILHPETRNCLEKSFGYSRLMYDLLKRQGRLEEKTGLVKNGIPICVVDPSYKEAYEKKGIQKYHSITQDFFYN